jgi:two-component sensor histidine kinase
VPDVKAAMTGDEAWFAPGCAGRGDAESEFAFRQLRHQVKNVLQRISLQIADAQTLRATVCSKSLLADLQRRILSSAEISDALFGLTRSPASMPERLQTLSDGTIRMLADDMQVIRSEVTVAGECPEPLRHLVLRVAHEFVGNAVRHGMRARVAGRISIQLATGMDGRTVLIVTDDGWGFEGSPDAGDGLTIAGDLAASAGGSVSLRRTGVTVAALELPATRAMPGFGDRSPGS